MSDEEKEDKLELTVEEPLEEKTEVAELPDHVKEAMSKGWKPKEDFKGDEDDWVGAKAFLKNEKLYSAVFNLEKKNKQMYKHFQEFSTLQKNKYERELQDKLHEVNAKMLQAEEDSNVRAIKPLVKETEKLERELAEVRATRVDPEVEEEKAYTAKFMEDNRDWVNHPEIGAVANSLYQVNLTNTGSTKDALEATKKRIKELYPDHFKGTKVEEKAVDKLKSPLPGSSSPSRGSKTKGSELVHLLSDREKSLVREFKRLDPNYTEADYAQEKYGKKV